MALLNDIRNMQSEGKTEQEIISTLRQKGISTKEIIESLSQSKIREAVGEAPETPPPYQTSSYEESNQEESSQESALPPRNSDVIPQNQMPNSKMVQEAAPIQAAPMEQSTQYQAQQPQANYQDYQQYPANQPQPQANYQDYQQQYQAQANLSPDTITEISEQVVTEKLSPLKEGIEKVLDMKTTLESKMEYIDERLKKIEKIIDRLNLSILQKVGDYMTNIDDIKKELIETQKSFKSLVPSLNSEHKDKAEKPKKPQLISEE